MWKSKLCQGIQIREAESNRYLQTTDTEHVYIYQDRLFTKVYLKYSRLVPPSIQQL
jgi:hypothetical protein